MLSLEKGARNMDIDMSTGSEDRTLTRDNIHLSQPKKDASDSGAVNCTKITSDFVRASIADNTRRAYRSDLKHFLDWGGVIPATDVIVADYLAAHADTLAVATLCRRIASISKAHTSKGLQSPTTSDLIKATLRGIKRTHGVPPSGSPHPF